MKWAIRIARVSGIDVRVHATFAIALLIGAYEAAQHYGARGSWFGIVLVSALFLCITLHELGHSLVAQRFGVQVREIVLLPIGGMARLGSEPQKPLHELLIAVAGPLVNVVIAGGLLAFMPLALGIDPLSSSSAAFQKPSVEGLLRFLFAGNVALAVFNMIPALPMDGGRVLRALMSFPLGKARATRISATIGQVIAAGFVWLGLFTPYRSPMLVIVGVFVFLAAAQERNHSTSNEVLAELRAAEVCDPNAVTLTPDEWLGNVVDVMLRTHQTHFAVLYGNTVLGTVSRDDVLSQLSRVGLRAPVGLLMRRDFQVVDPDTSLDVVRTRILESSGKPVVVAGEPDGFLGVLGAQDIFRIGSLAERLARAGVRRGAPQAVPERTYLG